MALTTHGGKKTINPFMSLQVEIETNRDYDVVDMRGESENATEKEVVVPEKVVLILDFCLPSHRGW